MALKAYHFTTKLTIKFPSHNCLVRLNLWKKILENKRKDTTQEKSHKEDRVLIRGGKGRGGWVCHPAPGEEQAFFQTLPSLSWACAGTSPNQSLSWAVLGTKPLPNPILSPRFPRLGPPLCAHPVGFHCAGARQRSVLRYFFLQGNQGLSPGEMGSLLLQREAPLAEDTVVPKESEAGTSSLHQMEA